MVLREGVEVTDDDRDWVDKITGHIKTPAFEEDAYTNF